MKKVILSESKLKNIISESVKQVLKEKWEEDYNAAMDKYDYENNKAEYDSKKWYQKIAAMISGNKPKDPNPQQTLKALLDGYVEAFNKEHGIGKRSEYGNGETFHSRMAYQSDNKQPVLRATYNSGDGYIQQSRKAFRNDGSKEEWGIAYPYSEMGVTGDEAPRNAHDSAKWEYNKFKRNQDEISNVIKNRNKRKGGK
jgi:hypothetical protein